jgi:hypothetical protein
MSDLADSRQRLLATLGHRQPSRLPVDFGGTFVSGIHVTCVAALRHHYGLGDDPVRVIDPGQMLGEIDVDLKRIIGIDTEAVRSRMTRYGFPASDWKPWRMDDGLEVLVPGGFNVTRDESGGTLLHPRGDVTLRPSALMPPGGYFFDSLIRQQPIDENRLDARDNLEEFQPISETDLGHFESMARTAASTGRAVVASFGGTSFGDIALVPGAGLAFPKGIRDVTVVRLDAFPARLRPSSLRRPVRNRPRQSGADRRAHRRTRGRDQRLRHRLRHTDFLVLLSRYLPGALDALLQTRQ